MNTKIVAASLLLAASVVPASAADTASVSAASTANVCLERNYIDGWGSRDDHSMVVNDIFGRKFLLTLGGLCRDIKFSFGVGVRPLGGFAGGLCVERGDRIVMRGGGALPIDSRTCWIQKVQRYTPDMAAADKAAKEAHQPLATY